MKNLNKVLDELIKNGTASHIAVRVGRRSDILCDAFRGGVDEKTLFDMASVTKIIATTTLALIALDRGLLSLDDRKRSRMDRQYPGKREGGIPPSFHRSLGVRAES